jgi:hypothetical protein
MMRAKADPKATSNTILVLACFFLAASAAAGVFMPKVETAVIRKIKADIKTQEETIRKAENDARIAKAVVQTQTWAGEDAAITGRILDMTTALARKHGVEYVRLQPQRAIVGGTIEQLPYLLVVEGPFPAVAALEKDLEVPANRLAVNAVQLASSDTETNKVSASIGIVANRVSADVENEEKTNGNRR